MRNDIIKKIELDLGGKRVFLTPEQAKRLKSALDELFGTKTEKEYIPYPIEPYRPWRWDWDRWKEPYYLTTCDAICKYDTGNELLTLTV